MINPIVVRLWDFTKRKYIMEGKGKNMSKNRYENMTKEEILKIAKEGIMIDNEEERRTIYNRLGLKTEEQKRHMMIKLLFISILTFALILAISKIFKLTDTTILGLVGLNAIIIIIRSVEIKVDRIKMRGKTIGRNKGIILTEYAMRRQTVLESLKEVIYSDDLKEDKKAHLYNLIYHNPWLIDEKLAFCDYISEINTSTLEQPVALSYEENTGEAYGAITILELDHSRKNDYTYSDNPILEMLEYIEKIEENTVTDKCGKQIKVNNHTQFYLYAVCDFTDSLKEVAERFDYSETSDKLGMYWYNRNFNAYIQLLSYDKIINDVRKRNKILFDKLGI